MRINYFGYYIIDKKTQKRILFDIRPFLKTFCNLDKPTFKNQFQYLDENLFLFHQIGDMFLFLMTRSNEIIKKINTNSMNLEEIYGLLGADEQLGFASYTILKDHYLGFGSTILAPKFPVFAEFINMIFKSIEITQFEIGIEPLLYQSSKKEALSIPFLGKATIEIQKENSFAKDIIDFIGANAEDVRQVDSFEIVVKPKLRQNIKGAVDKLLNKVPDDGLQKMIVKAKAEAQNHLSDLYLVGQGAISDVVNSKDETKIYNLFTEKMLSNEFLTKKIEDFKTDARFEEKELKALSRYEHADTWTDIFSGV